MVRKARDTKDTKRRATAPAEDKQSGAARKSSGAKRSPATKTPSFIHFFTRKSVLIPAMVLILILASTLLYYKPLKIWYREARQERVLREQLIAVREYNDELRKEITSLDTTEGIEDYATSQLNLVHEGDNVVIVTMDGKPLSQKAESRAEKIEELSVTSKPFGVWTSFLDSFFDIR